MRFLLIGVCIVSVLFSCKVEANDSRSENTRSVKIWAHRGCSCRYPENTLSAFKAACDLRGLAGIELDIQLTKEGEIVVIHDETVDRTTDGSGNVRDFTLQDIQNLKIGNDGAERIPTMREVLELVKPFCKRNGLLINIELKNSRVRYEGMEEKILRLVKEYGLDASIVYSSFNPDSLVLLKKLDPSVKTGILNSSESACLDFAMTHEVDALHPSVKHLDVADIRDKTSLPIRIWGATESFYPKEAEYEVVDVKNMEGIGVTDFITNVPEAYL